MKRYYHKEGTPLAFHKFLWYFSLPIGFLLSIGKMASEISKMTSFNWIYAVDIGYFIMAITLMLMCFIGFFSWKSYAWYGLMTYLYASVAYVLYAVIIYAYYTPDQIGTAIGQLLGMLIYAILVGIYYKKRRPLFFPVMVGTPDNPQSAVVGKDNSQYSKALPQVRYCRKCGCELLDGSDFCRKCGAPIVKECFR